MGLALYLRLFFFFVSLENVYVLETLFRDLTAPDDILKRQKVSDGQGRGVSSEPVVAF